MEWLTLCHKIGVAFERTIGVHNRLSPYQKIDGTLSSGLTLHPQFEIVWTIVAPNAILMMDCFTWQQRTPKHRGHDEAMLRNLAIFSRIRMLDAKKLPIPTWRKGITLLMQSPSARIPIFAPFVIMFLTVLSGKLE